MPPPFVAAATERMGTGSVKRIARFSSPGGGSGAGILRAAEIVAHQGEAEDAALKAVGEAREERRFLLVFEEIELADDEVALLAGANELFELGWWRRSRRLEPVASGYMPPTNSA